MKWKPAPLIKIYEALGSIADERYEIDGTTAKVYSSSGNKYYEVVYDPTTQAITANDNGSYWVGYLGYPSILLLLVLGIVEYEPNLALYLKGFAWKDINQKFKNDFDKTQAYVDEQIVRQHHINLDDFHKSLEKIQRRVNALELSKLENGKKPPSGY